MDSKTYNNEEYFAESFRTFAELRESEQTCDISIITSNNKIKAHKLVLASASEYFKNAIYGLFLNDSSKNELKLNEIQYVILLVIVNYMYTGIIEINSENVYDIYNAANYCLMNFVQMRCLEFLLENVNADNCVKIWIMANNCKYDKLRTAAANTIFSNLEISSNTSEFSKLSKDELIELLGLWPKDKLFDSIISAALKWATDKEHWEDTFIKIFKDLPCTKINDNYLENEISNNELIQNSLSCSKWMMNIYKEKSKISKLKEIEFEAELKFNKFLVDQPIMFMECSNSSSGHFYKYNLRDGEWNSFRTISDNDGSSCESYKKYIYVLGYKYCRRFSFDNPNNEFETVFEHNHGCQLNSAVLNDSIYLFGGQYALKKGSIVDLNTKQCTSFSLLHERTFAGIAVNDGSIYVCGGWRTNIVEHFDPREGRTTEFGSIPFPRPNYTFAAALPNQIYCVSFDHFKMIDLRNNRTWINIKSPEETFWVQALISSHGRLFSVCNNTIYEYHLASERWNTLNRVPVDELWCTTSFE